MCHMGAAQRRLQLIAASEVSGLQTNTAQLSLSLSLSLSLLLSRTHRCPPNWAYLWGLCQWSRHLFEFKYQHIIYGGAVSSKPHRITRQGYLTNALTELNSDSPRPASTHTHTYTAPAATLICQQRVVIELQAWSWIRGNCAVCLSCLFVSVPCVWLDLTLAKAEVCRGCFSCLRFSILILATIGRGCGQANGHLKGICVERFTETVVCFLLNVPLTLMRQFQWDGFV